jgi:glutaredoxin
MVLESNAYVRRVGLYADMFTYNTSGSFGPKLPPTVPSSNFPTILDTSVEKSYGTLTYNNSPNSYPSVDDAYTFKEPKYFVGKCPSNKKIRDFGPSVVPSPTPEPPKKKEKSCNVVNEPIIEQFEDIEEQLKNLNIMLFVDKKCPFSRKQLEQTTTKSMKVFDIKNKKHKQQFTDYGGFATPFFFSTSSNRSYTGFDSNPSRLLKNLSIVENFSSGLDQRIKDLEIVIYSSKHCPYCNMLHKMLSDKNQLQNVDLIDDMTKMENVDKIEGFPYIFSRKTNKNMTGCPQDLESMIMVLENDNKSIERTKL